MSISPNPPNTAPVVRRRRRPGQGQSRPIGDAARPGRLNDVRAAQREYVAGGVGGWTAKARSLPQTIDDLTVDFGSDIYDQMLLDAQVAACAVVLKASIVEDGCVLSSAVNDPDEDNYKLAMDIRDAATRMLELLDQPLDEVLFTMLDGIFFGNKVAEIVSELQQVDGVPRLNVVAIKPKPRQAVAFVVDAYLNVVGIMGAKPGEFTPFGTGNPIQPNDPRIIDREKFAVFSFRVKDGDPRGTSLLRAVYEPWWRKRQVTQDYLKYLSQFAGPSLWATPPEGTTVQPLTDAFGNAIEPDLDDPLPDDGDGDFDSDVPTASDDLVNCLLDFRNGTVLAVPFGTEIHAIEMQGDGNAFLRAKAEADEQITKAMLTQQLATEEGAHQTRAAAQVHQDVLDTIVRQSKHSLERMIEHDILAPWVLNNFGPKAADLVPIPTLGTTERQDQSPLMTAVAALQRAGFIHPSQYPAIDALLGLPVRDLTMMPDVVMPPPQPAPGEPGNNSNGAGPGMPQRGGTTPPKPPAPASTPATKPATPKKAADLGLVGPPRAARRRWLPGGRW